MSVNHSQARIKIAQVIKQQQNFVSNELKKYDTYLRESANQIKNTINMHLSHFIKQQESYKAIIYKLQNQIIQLKDDNSFLRNQYMINSIKQEELKNSRQRILEENAQKELRVQELAEQVKKIKMCMSNIEQPQNIVNFDEGDSPIRFNNFEGLEVINEVSEHDISLSMSVRSDLIQETHQSVFQTPTENSIKQKESHQSLGGENYQIQNYQDALSFLKSYNSNGRGMKMTKKPIISTHSNIKDDSSLKSNRSTQKRGNQTINKIKRMRKIQDFEVDAFSSSKQNQQNISPFEKDHANTDPYVSIVESKIQLQEETLQASQNKSKSSTSINSNKFTSRIKDSLVNLEDPIKRVVQLLLHINTSNMHIIKREIKNGKYGKIAYVGGLQYLGNFNQNQQPSKFGKLLLNKEIIYQGQWRSGKFHGWGKLVLLPFTKEGEKSIIQIDGYFKCGMVEGSVVCTFSSGERFMGMIRNQNIEKEGTFVGEKGIMTGFWESNKLIYLI